MATVVARPRIVALRERAIAALWALALLTASMGLLTVTIIGLLDTAPVSTPVLVGVPILALVTLFVAAPERWLGRRVLELRRTVDGARMLSAGALVLTIPLAAMTLLLPEAPEVSRVAGDDRIGTAIALSEAAFEAADTVVLVEAGALAAAVAAAPLAGASDAPLLLTVAETLPGPVADEIARLGATTAYVVGAAVGPGVEDDLRAAGVASVERIAGGDLFATAALVAERVRGEHAYLVQGAGLDDGQGWPDAVSVTALAAWQGHPVLLAAGDELPEATLAAIVELGIGELTLVGGEAVLAEEVGEVLEAAGLSVSRLAGEDRYGTSVAVANRAREEGARGARAWIATGADWPDALAAGPAVAHAGDVLVLLPPAHGHEAATRSWLNARWTDFDEVVLIGGTRTMPDSAVSGLGGRWR